MRLTGVREVQMRRHTRVAGALAGVTAAGSLKLVGPVGAAPQAPQRPVAQQARAFPPGKPRVRRFDDTCTFPRKATTSVNPGGLTDTVNVGDQIKCDTVEADVTGQAKILTAMGSTIATGNMISCSACTGGTSLASAAFVTRFSPVTNQFKTQVTTADGAVWVNAPPQCVGIGTITLACTFTDTITTP